MNQEEPTPVLPVAPPLAQLADLVDLACPLRLGDCDDVVSAVPYLLGFHPHDCVVVLACADRKLVVTGRLPLSLTDDALALDYALRTMAARASDPTWILVGYGEQRQRVSAAMKLAGQLVGMANVIDTLYVDRGRYWSLMCNDPYCCPEEGTPYDASTSPAALQAVMAGLHVVDSRDRLRDRIKAPGGWTARAASRRFTRAKELLQEIGPAAAVQRFDQLLLAAIDDPSGLDVDELALLAAAVTDPLLRHSAYRQMHRRDAWRHVEIWQRVVRATARANQASALAMLGLSCWMQGDGALQSICVERAKKLDPHHGLLRLLEQAQCTAAPPSQWDRLWEDMFGDEATG